MPHKHTRAKDDAQSNYNLPPSVVAKPLPVVRTKASKPGTDKGGEAARAKKKRKSLQNGAGENDTPKAFLRLMQFRRTGKVPDGLDDGEYYKRKKRKVLQEDVLSVPEQEIIPKLKIMPGERISDFSARVDQALPVAGLSTKGKKVRGVKDRQTKHERRLQKMVATWKEEDVRIKEREQEARELAEEEEDAEAAMWEDKTQELPGRGKKGKRKKVVGEQGDNDDDPWKFLKSKREEPKGLHDVAQAPPQFTKLPKEKFKITGGARVEVSNVPKSAGSLRRREELGEARKSIVDSYRELMAKKRGGLGG
ncbi:hypothetical protein M501DRAFT_1003495 [Patellaria atrata CBS 101060]|uniref:Urease accessory protein UreD n=1 Tax=Patellaria atrata CBS 101060 TaxID=1346257 RepID=A0A9P4VLF3_9PEZI|nr:hypothetical protein M501DRAFT_1003495 [Patellaria atrata CBS 101060]